MTSNDIISALNENCSQYFYNELLINKLLQHINIFIYDGGVVVCGDAPSSETTWFESSMRNLSFCELFVGRLAMVCTVCWKLKPSFLEQFSTDKVIDSLASKWLLFGKALKSGHRHVLLPFFASDMRGLWVLSYWVKTFPQWRFDQ